jgi:hypothetical protein
MYKLTKHLMLVLILFVALGINANLVEAPDYESDNGDDPYTKGYHSGTYPWGYTTNMIPDACRLNNFKVDSCSGSGCSLMEYYFRYDGFLFWHFYRNVECEDGALVEQLTLPVSPATTYQLEDYPEMFDDNGDFDGIIVIPENYVYEDYAAETITEGLTEEGYIHVQTVFDTDVIDYTQNMIVIGEVCNNAVMQELLGYNNITCQDANNDLGIGSGETYIGLFESNLENNYLIITGEYLSRGGHVLYYNNHEDLLGQYMIYSHGSCRDWFRDTIHDIVEYSYDLVDDLDDLEEDYLIPNNYPYLDSFRDHIINIENYNWDEIILYADGLYYGNFGYYTQCLENEEILINLEEDLENLEDELNYIEQNGYADSFEVLDVLDWMDEIYTFIGDYEYEIVNNPC